MKTVEEVVACVIDYGSFISLAEKLGEKMARCYYYSPFEEEFRDAQKCVVGTGLKNVVRLDEFMDPDALKEIDLFVFPDIGYGGLQRHLRYDLGKSVWGSMGASDLELYRTQFLERLADAGLPVAPSEVIRGLTNLKLYLQRNEDKWVKVNRFRENMETWHHIDWEHSQPMLASLSTDFGGIADKVVFVVQDPILHAQEVGYDGFCIDGKYPAQSYQGYEAKNELYLGSLLGDEEMPDAVKMVNEAMAPFYGEIEYRNFLATEIRGEFFIDPTNRMAGQTQEHLLETCTNLAEVIWLGAQGELVQPKFGAKFAAEATLHYTDTYDWKVLRIPETVRQWVKLYHFCEVDGWQHFPPHKTDEVGVVIGNGDTIEDAIENLKEHYEALEEEPVKAKIERFVDLLKEVKEAQAKGIHFADQKIPPPTIAIK